MTEKAIQALKNAAASSAIEGLPMEQRHFDAIKQIKDGNITLQEYFQRLKAAGRKR